MKKVTFSILKTLVLLPLAIVLVLPSEPTFWQSVIAKKWWVPDYYYANYEFIDSWNGIWNTFDTISNRYDLNLNVENRLFRDLLNYFNNTFLYLPQDYSAIYEKCQLLATKMVSGQYTDTELASLLWNTCYKKLYQAMAKINSDYTVKVSVTPSSAAWQAPATITFDAGKSIDPSWETIPTDNYFWYYRDENWVDTPMGRWEIIHYEFKEAGKFIVHLVVRSSNAKEWIMDGEQDITVNISPKAANIIVYANTRKMNANESLKIWIDEWSKWIVFDWTTTTARWGREILSHTWKISNQNIWFYKEYSYAWTPSYISANLSGNGEYKITLSVKDNENNVTSETFSLYMTDPVAIIKQSPEIWTTSTVFSFDWSASYSLHSKLNTYVWEIFDEDWNKLKTDQGKKISKKFLAPGNYLIKLTTTDLEWNKNIATEELFVESTAPTPQFTISATSKWEKPSEFTLDASSSMDVDVTNKVDSLTYEWRFSNPEKVTIVSTTWNNEKVTVQFNEIWKHTIYLKVTDMYDKTVTISKTIEVKSVLRPEITAIPNAITRGKLMKFESSVNGKIINYVRNFGDEKKTLSSELAVNVEHIYATKGIYSVSLTVYDGDDSNTVTERVFIWEVEYPIAAYRVKDGEWYTIQASEICKIEWGWEEKAYPIDRLENFSINPSISVNTQWNSNGLEYRFEKESLVGSEKAIQKTMYTNKFNQLGCHYVDLTIKDTNIWKQDKVRIRFDVKNSLPKISNVVLSFPQYSDNNSIGYSTDSTKSVFDCSWSSNLTIKVTAVNATDPDWSISRLRFYYYNVDDPDRILEYKDTWISTPYVYFVIPRIAWEYKFWVMVYDNDWWMVNSDDVLTSNPSVYFPWWCWESDVPSVVLKVSSENIEVWDTVTYSIISKISSDNQDFETDRTFYYDFDWDWIWDLVTKKDTATYTFLEDHEDWIEPRAAVEYRSKLWIWTGARIVVKNWIKPILLYNSYNNTVIFRDLSVWVLQQRQLCFEKTECDAWNTKYRRTHVITSWIENITWWTETEIKKHDSFLRKYDSYGQHNVSIYLKNKYGISVYTGFTVKTSANEKNGRIAPWVNMITIPETTFNNNWDPEIFLSKIMDNSLLLFMSYENWGSEECYIDVDISKDSWNDGDTANDRDLSCNTLQKIQYEPTYDSIIWRVYFTTKEWQKVYKNFYVTFEGYVSELNEEEMSLYNDISQLINGIEDIAATNNTELKTSLDILRKNLQNKNKTSSTVLMIKWQLEDWLIKISESQKELLDSILVRLENWDTVLAGESIYEISKREILAILPTAIKSEVQLLFGDFERKTEDFSNPEEIANELKSMWSKIIELWNQKWGLDNTDVELVLRPAFCDICDYYDVSSFTNTCSDTPGNVIENATNQETISDESKKWWNILRIIIIVLVSGLLIMGWVIVFFAIKAKLNSASEDDDG